MIHLLGLDWQTAPLEVREGFALESGAVAELLAAIKKGGAEGCFLLQTCNRFELYIDAPDSDGQDWLRLLLQATHARGDAQAYFIYRRSDEAIGHLCRVACGLHSQILGEDQILAQVKCASKSGRQAGTASAALETLFRIAVTAGKLARTQVKLSSASHSSATLAVELAEGALGSLGGRRAVVIGNGEMGRLAANLLVDKGAEVTITLRSYKHGQTIVPRGCSTVPYEQRAQAMDGADLLISATKSPHYTVDKGMLSRLAVLPRVVADIAVPRDIDPACRDIAGLTLFDMDDLRTEDGHNIAEIQQVEDIIARKLQDYHKWQQGRQEHARAQGQQDGGHKADGRSEGPGRLAIFAGTSEGRELCTALSAAGMEATVCVATDYGRELLQLPGMDVRSGRMDAPTMLGFLRDYDTVVDATHPYAVEASANISAACQKLDLRYLRLLRPGGGPAGGVVEVADAASAVDYLAGTQGNVLLTTGSKQLDEFTRLPDYKERLYPRMLPDAASVARGQSLGFSASRLICMQGPFTHEMNVAMLKMTGAKYLVTKDSGRAGGLAEKLSAANELGCTVVMITRPGQEQGYIIEELLDELVGAEVGQPQPLPAAFATPDDACPPRFPLFVNLRDKPCLVVGCGEVALRRIEVLQSFGARVRVVAAEFRRRPQGVELVQCKYNRGDTEGMALVVAATNDRLTNSRIAKECGRAGIPVSVADCPGESSFFFPAICRGDRLVAGLVSGGNEHRLVARAAKGIRELLKEMEA